MPQIENAGHRPFFKLHYSTVIFQLITAAVFVLLNLGIRKTDYIIKGWERTFFGWPFTAGCTETNFCTSIPSTTTSFTDGLYEDLAFAITALVLVGALSEWSARRRKAATDQTRVRKFWQLHLSTALLVIFAVNALMYLNVRRSDEWVFTDYPDFEVYQFYFIGFPFTARMKGEQQHKATLREFIYAIHTGQYLLEDGRAVDVYVSDWRNHWNWREDVVRNPEYLSLQPIRLNIAFGMLVLFAIAVASEAIIRRGRTHN